MNVVEVEGLNKNFGNFEALKQVGLTVKKGEIHGFIGPNGAGKSTTIRILLGMLKSDSGKVSIFEKDSWKDAVEIHKDIAYVPGDTNLWPNLTGGEVIDLFLKMRGKKINQERKDELIELFDFDPTKKCRTYSKGNRQKVTLISALAADADLYILDEPTSGLDPLMERKFQEEILKEKEKGKSVLLSSHILSEVEKLCDSISIIREGEIIESGSLEELRHLTRLNFVVETTEPLKNLEGLEGIHNINQKGSRAEFQVDNEKINEIIHYIGKYDLVNLKSTPPTLEDLFIRHYEDENGGQS